MTIENIVGRFKPSSDPTDEPPSEHELARERRERLRAEALAALRADEQVRLRERSPEPTEQERERDLNKWLMAGIGAGAVTAAIGIAAVVHHRKKAPEADDASA